MLLFLALLSLVFGEFVVPPSNDPPALYPQWAHSHQVWLPSGHNQSDCIQFVNDFLSRNISVGGTNIDSNWATGFNTFVWRSDNFPDPKAMVDNFHSLGVRVIAWATSLIDTNAPNYAFAKQNDFLLSKGEPVKWWHGEGAFLDFTYQPAVDYWKSLMDNVLVNQTQLDGFKCDGTDPYIWLLDLKGGAKGHDGKLVHYREYADLYYGSFLNHSRSRNPYAIIWSRPVDSLSNKVYMDFSPRYATFSGWVGDQDPTFSGLLDAMNNMLRSAWANAVSFGSDTGGYRCCGSTDKKHGRTREVLLRWAQLNSCMGLFENGGDNEHRPWMFDEPDLTTSIYRQYVDLHTSLEVYLLTTGSEAFEAGISIVRPVAKKPLFDFDPSTYAYFLGPSVFVDPILKSNVSSHRVEFPKGKDYVDWFNKSLIYKGGSSLDYSCPLDGGKYPVFHVRGNLIPIFPRPQRNSDLLVPKETDEIEMLLPCPQEGDEHTVVIRRFQMASQRVSYGFHDDTLTIQCTAHVRPLSFRVTGLEKQFKMASISNAKQEDDCLSFKTTCEKGRVIKIKF